MFSIYSTSSLYLIGLLFGKIKIEPPDLSILVIKVNLACIWFYYLSRSKTLDIVGGEKENYVFKLRRVQLRTYSKSELTKIAIMHRLI